MLFRSRLYVSSFQPRSQKPWLGNLKKYAVDGEGRIVDRNGAAALCPDAEDASACVGTAAGEFKPGSASFWSERADGDMVTAGGAGGVLLSSSERRIYSNLSGMVDLTDESNAVTVANLSPARLGLGDAEAAGRLLAYLHGADAFDEDGDGMTDESREIGRASCRERV